MHKNELIDGLRQFMTQYGVDRGEKAIANFLIYYFENLDIPYDKKYDFWTIENHLPELIVDAFELLRTGTSDEIITFRRAFESGVGHNVPNISDIGASSILDQTLIVCKIGFMLQKITGEDWIEKKIDAYCNAQRHVLQQTFDKFLRLVYRKGLGELISKCKKCGMSGKFGDSELRTYTMAGRIMFTFSRRIDKNKDNYYEKDGELYCNEWSISFVGEDGDPLCLGAGIQSVCADFRTALDIIEDIVKNWPQDKNGQNKIYRADKKVAII